MPNSENLTAQAAKAQSNAEDIVKGRRFWSWKKIALAIALLALSAEGLMRLALGNIDFSPPVFRINGDSYGLLADQKAKVRQFGRTLSISTDGDGRRITPGAPAAGAPVLHLVGDSQVFGWGLSDQETIAAQMQKMLGGRVRVVNDGVPGYGPLDYIKTLRSIPQQDRVVVLHTEENDAWDAYGLFRHVNVACGYLISSGMEGDALRCALMKSLVLQASLEAWDDFVHYDRPTPLGFDQRSVVAATVLNARIANLYREQREKRGSRLAFTIIPWKARFSPSWLQRYSPPPFTDAAAQPSPFEDDLDMLSYFRGTQQPLYLETDAHLAPAGARRVAEKLAQWASDIK
ncbi:alginate O-acetyltransferase AlgX-related protein [Chromobacterium sp. CV08]|uniref:alginate O-acetyltransferase AlgX-related protein n=1 Tax=Chromobacterium sp. CV08 TaxID=3133274 RepID=UPI003DA928C4